MATKHPTNTAVATSAHIVSILSQAMEMAAATTATIVSAERRKSGLCCFSITATARSREPELEPVGREGGNLTIPRTSMDGASPGGGAEQRELVAVDHREGGHGDN